MKRDLAKSSETILKHKELNIDDYNTRKRRIERMNELGVAPYYTDNTSDIELNLKFYKTLGEYEVDMLQARLLIMEDKEIPQELYEKLLYTKREIESKNNSNK